jgi:hypothetical protein
MMSQILAHAVMVLPRAESGKRDRGALRPFPRVSSQLGRSFGSAHFPKNKRTKG